MSVPLTRAGGPAVVAQNTAKAQTTQGIPQAGKVLNEINSNGISSEEALSLLWSDTAPPDAQHKALNMLRNACDTNTTEALVTRLQVTEALATWDPSLKRLATHLQNKVNDLSASHQVSNDPQKVFNDRNEAVKNLVKTHLTTSTKIAALSKNVFFSFIHLARLEIKTAVSSALSTCLARKAVQAEDAQAAVDKSAVRKEMKGLLRQSIHPPQTTRADKPVPIIAVAVKKSAEPTWSKIEAALKKLPDSIKQHHNWGNVENRMKAYLNHTMNYQGNDFPNLLEQLTSGQIKNGDKVVTLTDLLDSMKIKCNLDKETTRKLAFQRDLCNIAQKRSSSQENEQVTGWGSSFVNATAGRTPKGEVADVLLPGNQLAMAIDTPMKLNNSTTVSVTILSLIGPALDSKEQPEYALYAKTVTNPATSTDIVTEFNTERYEKAHETLNQQILAFARTHPEKKSFTLTGVGLGNYLSALAFTDFDASKDMYFPNTVFLNQAIEIGVAKIAEVAIDLS